MLRRPQSKQFRCVVIKRRSPIFDERQKRLSMNQVLNDKQNYRRCKTDFLAFQRSKRSFNGFPETISVSSVEVLNVTNGGMAPVRNSQTGTYRLPQVPRLF